MAVNGYSTSTKRSTLQHLVARGFAAPAPAAETPVMIVDKEAVGIPPSIGIFLPTMTSRLREGASHVFIRKLVQQVRDARLQTDVVLHLFVMVQFPEGRQADAHDVVHTMLRVIEDEKERHPVEFALTVMVSRGPGKVRSLNQMTGVATARSITAVILIDDDVSFSPGCFARLISAYHSAEKPVAIGAIKAGQPFLTPASRLLHRVRTYTQPAQDYPHACCMIVTLNVISPEIPPIYTSDDGYIFFRLLQPGFTEPLARLRLQNGTRCSYMVGAPTSSGIAERIRRTLLHHHLFISHFELEKGAYCRRHMLFHGLWPWVPFDASNGIRNGLAKCLLKHIYAAWFIKIGVELVVRGIVGKQLRDIAWGGWTNNADQRSLIKAKVCRPWRPGR